MGIDMEPYHLVLAGVVIVGLIAGFILARRADSPAKKEMYRAVIAAVVLTYVATSLLYEWRWVD